MHMNNLFLCSSLHVITALLCFRALNVTAEEKTLTERTDLIRHDKIRFYQTLEMNK